MKILNYIQIKMHEAFGRDYIKALLVFLVFLACFSLVYFTLDRFITTDDQFFHIRFAEMIRQKGFGVFEDFHWLYFSKISLNQEYFIYYNFLFYIILIPFTFITPLFLGIKLYGIVFASLSFTLLYYFFLKMKEKNAFFWTVLALSIFSYGYIGRFLTTRPFTLAPVLLLLLLYFVYKKNYLAIFLISFLYFYWHTVTFFFVSIVVGVYFLFENFYGKKLDWKLVGSSLLGVSAAFLISLFFAPGVVYYIKDLMFNGVVRDSVFGSGAGILEGKEVYGEDFVGFIRGNSLIFALLLIAVVFEVFQYVQTKRIKKNDSLKINQEKQPLKSTLFFLSVCFFLGLFLSKRNVDFFLFFSAAYIPMTFNMFLKQIEFKNCDIKKSLKLGLSLSVTCLFLGNLILLYEGIAFSSPYNGIRGAAEWLEANTKKGDIVFNAASDWFTTLFYYNQHNYYIVGIEPRFLYDYNPELYWSWWNISTNGYLCQEKQCVEMQIKQQGSFKNEQDKKRWYENEGNQIADFIKKSFKSNYVVTSRNFSNLNGILNNSARFEKVYTDIDFNTFFVYRVK